MSQMRRASLQLQPVELSCESAVPRSGWEDHDLDAIAAADTVVVSPGIPPSAPVLAALRARGVAWVSSLTSPAGSSRVH